MRLLKYSFILILLMLITINPVFAFETNAMVKFDVPYGTIYGGTFDNLVLDFTLVTIKTDTLKAVSLKNLGSADYLSHIKALTLWADVGDYGFQGFGYDTKLGNFTYYKTYNAWSLENLALKINDSQRFFVSLEAYSSISSGATVQMQIPLLVDNNQDGSFNLGDFGIFMDSGNNGPANAAVSNSNLKVFSLTFKDSFGPVVAWSNLAAGQTVNNDSFLVKGLARDQGSSGLRDLKIIIDEQEYLVLKINSDFTWDYFWENISDGEHFLKIVATDFLGNIGQASEITVNVLKQNIIYGNSVVQTDKSIISDTGINAANITVTLHDELNQPVVGRQIRVETTPGLYLNWLVNNEDYDFSDANGQVKFQVASSQIGLKNITVWADNQKIGDLEINVLPSALLQSGLTAGDLIKASSQAVYYYACNGLRQAFPNESVYFSWFSDFKTVKTITDEQLASLTLGSNVTYKPGKNLVKIQTDNKVYAVDNGGILRWITSESLAKGLYGNDWASKVMDVTPAFFINYKVGQDIEKIGDYNPQNVSAASSKIDQELCLPL